MAPADGPAHARAWFADGIGAALVESDSRVHALRNTISGPRPWCGAGPVVRLLEDSFTEATPQRCPTCSDLVLALLPRQRSSGV